MRHVTQEGLDLVKRFEGFSPTVYICPGGLPTIGYGHVVKDHEREHFEAGIDEEMGEGLLRRDDEVAERAALRLNHVPLDDGQFDAFHLVSLHRTRVVGVRRRRQRSRRSAVGATTWTLEFCIDG